MKDAILQASNELEFTGVGVMETAPLPFRKQVVFWQAAVGLTLSTTVINAVQLDVFPLGSFTESITVFIPVLMQVNVNGLTESPTGPQRSFEPLFTADGKTKRFPIGSRKSVVLLQIALGRTVSLTVTLDVQVDVFP